MLSDRRQRLITLGYLGHMWELYALCAWLPAYVAASYAAWSFPVRAAAVGVTVFVTIGVAGAVGCMLAGLGVLALYRLLSLLPTRAGG